MLKKTIITIAISAVIGGAVALAPVDAFARGGAAVVVVTWRRWWWSRWWRAVVVTVVVGSPEDTVVGSPVGMVAGLAAAASVAVGLGVASGVVRLAVSAAGSVVSAEPRLVAGFAELDLTASAAEASASLAFAATGAFPSRQV